jgi:hypothetical protein
MRAIVWFITGLCMLAWIAGLFGYGAGPILGEAQHGILLIPLLSIFIHVVAELLKNEDTSET